MLSALARKLINCGLDLNIVCVGDDHFSDDHGPLLVEEIKYENDNLGIWPSE